MCRMRRTPSDVYAALRTRQRQAESSVSSLPGDITLLSTYSDSFARPPAPPHPHTSLPFFTLQQLRLPRCRPSLRSRNIFTASIVCFQLLFFAKRKAELLGVVEEGEGKRAQRGGCRGEGGNKNKGTERRKRFGFKGGEGLRTSRRSLLNPQARRESSERKSRERLRRNQSATKAATKASDIETPKDERSEHCDGA